MSAPLPFRIAFITGLSNPHSWALSPVQHEFIHAFGLPEDSIFPLSFPYTPCRNNYVRVPLWRAGVNSAALFMSSQSARFRDQYQASTIEFLQAAEHTILLAGSSGLELLNNLQLPPSVLERISVFAYGPISRQRPRCRHVLVQGTQDFYSKGFHRRVDHYVTCGHMGYLENSDVRRLCARFIEQVLKDLEAVLVPQ
jgi:hypothetical protein